MTNHIDSIKNSGHQFYFIATGGGTKAISDILSSGGASACFLGAQVPYSRKAICQLLGEKPDKYVTPEVSIAYAKKAVQLAAELSAKHIVGVGVTARLGYPTQRDGRSNEIYVTIAHSDTMQTITFYREFSHNISREAQEVLSAVFVINSILRTLNTEG